jgi:hypothetical protein
MIDIKDLHKDLNKENDKKDKILKEDYKKILNMCIEYISEANKNDQTNCIYQVPEFLFSMQIYDVVHCTKYIHKQLIKNKLKAVYYEPNYIYIEWGK